MNPNSFNTNSDQELSYLARIARADKLAQSVLIENPELDYSDLLHTFLCLDLSPSERLQQCLARYGYCSF